MLGAKLNNGLLELLHILVIVHDTLDRQLLLFQSLASIPQTFIGLFHLVVVHGNFLDRGAFAVKLDSQVNQ